MSVRNVNWTELARNGAISYDFMFVMLNLWFVMNNISPLIVTI